jgi:hypothetical protein
MADPAAFAILVPTLVTLDAIAARGAGRLAVIPRAVNTVNASEHRGWPFVAWPKANFDAIVQADATLGFYGSQSINAANAQVAALIDAGNNLQLAFVKGSASTVDEIRMVLRNRLIQVGVQLAPAPTTPKPSKKFPWGWILGTVALGLGLGFVLLTAEKKSEKSNVLPGDSE